jgi:2-oxoglutarate dehydrogenase E2 component (dihydrolipoamide succinyltransferase)
MSIELKVPEVGESVTEVEIGEWLKAAGQTVRKDEPLVTLESEKATVELAAPEAGVVGRVLKEKGATAKVGEVIGYLEKSGTVQPSAEKPKPEPASSRAPVQPAAKPTDQPRIMPAAELALAEHHLRAEEVQPTGPGGRILKEDVLRVAAQPSQPGPAPAVSSPGQASPAPEPAASIAGREQEVVPMSRLRRTLADRLVSAQHNAALLTTFNEVDMGQVMALRKEHGEAFQQNYQVKLGFMSFFVKACIDGLKQDPRSIDRVSQLFRRGCGCGQREGFGGAGAAQRRTNEFRADRGRDRGFRATREGKQVEIGRTPGRNIYD